MRRRRRASGPFLFGLLGCLLLLLVRGAEGGAAASRKRLPDKVVSGEEGGGDADPAKKGSVDDVLNKAKEYLAAQESMPLTIPSAGDLLRRYRELAFQGTGFSAGSALFDLATFHLDGSLALGVTRDLDTALELVVRSAKEHGNPEAQHLLAVAYATGILGKVDVPKPGEEEAEGPSDEVKAIMHDYFGAMGGNVRSAMALGYRYLYGHGTPASCESAVLYYEIAANAAIEEMYRLKVLPPNERTRISDLGPGGNKQGPKHRAGEADQQLVEYYEHTAEKGDMGAQVALGRLYYHGSQGVEQNFEKAALHFERAAKAGDPTAAGSMGQMYSHGVGVPQNNETALRYFRQGELSGDAASLNGLGYLYLYGMGVERSIDRAAKYFHKAAHEKGNSDAFFNLGLIYAGIVTQSGTDETGTTAAAKEAAGETAEPSTAKPIGVDGKGKAVPQPRPSGVSAPPEAMGEGGAGAGTPGIATTAGAAPLSPTQAQQGVVGEKGEGVKKNLQKALKYFSLSAQAGHMAALHKIGQMYSQGIATGKSCSTAVHAFKGVAERGSWVKNLSRAYNKYKRGDLESALLDYIKMAELGYEVAQSNAAILLGDHVCLNLSPLDCQRLSFRYYRHASKQGNAEASLKVGDTYYYGKAGLEVDYERAAKYYQAAAELRQPQAMFNLGYMHQHGIGLKQDFHLSKRFYDSAAETHPDARWPVNLALLGLYLHWWYQKEAHDDIITTGPAATHATSAADLRSAGGSGAVEGSVWDWVLRGLGSEREQGEEAWEAMAKRVTDAIARLADTLAPSSSEPLHRRGGEAGGRWGEVVPAMDTLAILVLSTLFLLVMRARMQQVDRRRRGAAEGQGGGPSPIQHHQPAPQVAAADAAVIGQQQQEVGEPAEQAPQQHQHQD